MEKESSEAFNLPTRRMIEVKRLLLDNDSWKHMFCRQTQSQQYSVTYTTYVTYMGCVYKKEKLFHLPPDILFAM